MVNPVIEILILNHNGNDIVDECLHSIFEKTTYQKYKVVLIDNGSTDTCLERIEKKYKNKMLFIKLPNNAGFSKGMNRGIEERLLKDKSDFFVLLNNDIVITDPDWIQKLLHPMNNDNTIGITCGALTTPSGRLQVGGLMKFNGLTMSYIGTFDTNKDRFLDFAQMAACLIRREVLIKTKGFDEQYTPFNSEENDLSIRAKYLGYNIYFVHDLILLHKHSVSLRKVESSFVYYISKRNCIRFRLLHYPLHWIFLSLLKEYRVLLSIFFSHNGRTIQFNKTWHTVLKGYVCAIIVNVLRIDEIIDRRMQLHTQKKP